MAIKIENVKGIWQVLRDERIRRDFEIEPNTPEPKVDKKISEKVDYVNLEDLSTGDILEVVGDKHSHPNANYLIDIIQRDETKRVRIWNKGRGHYCFSGALESIFYHDRKEGMAELGALKVGTASVWPYFIIHGDSLQPANETWCDGVGEILLQKNKVVCQT